VKQAEHLVKLKGRAWIATDTYQIVRLETDLAEEFLRSVCGRNT
jgi:hypothetical protein